MKINNRYLIETDSGYQEFLGVQESIKTGLIIEHENGTINCTEKHSILIDKKLNIFKYADELNVNDFIENSKITKITKETSNKKYYDPINVKGNHTYISENVTHHNCAVIDEAAWINSNRYTEFIDAFLPSQSSLAWKKNIILSTPNGINEFYNLVQGASPDYLEESTGRKFPGENHNGYTLFKTHWEDVPRYDNKGNLLTPADFKDKIMKKHGPIYWNQNYGLEFLGSSFTLISSDRLKQMHPKECEEIRDGKLNIYHYPEEKHRYIMTVDASKDGSDNFAVQIVDITDFKFKQVAAAKLQVDYLLMPEFLNEWCEFYNNPYLIIENNEGAGQSIADQMKNDYEYENLHYDKDVGRNKRKKYPGFRTTTKSRKQILQTLKLFIENGNLDVVDNDTIKEFFRFILINNKYQADQGAHDDMIMSLALVFVPFVNSKNFEDMKLLIKHLYLDCDIPDAEKVNFGEMMTIGSFDDGSDEDYMNMQNDVDHYNYDDNGFM